MAVRFRFVGAKIWHSLKNYPRVSQAEKNSTRVRDFASRVSTKEKGMVSLRVEERPTDLVMNNFEKLDRHSGDLQPQDREKDLYCSSEVHILILDDDPSVARIMQTALSHKDFMIDVMAEPTQMEAQLQARPYHIVIL